MARVPVNASVNHDFSAATPSVEGYYIETKHNQGPKQNSCIHTFKKDNEFTSFWGSHVVDNLIAKRTPGEYLYIDFKGMNKSKAGNDYKVFEVAFDDAIEPISLGTPATSNATEAASPAPQTEQAAATADQAGAPLQEDDDLPF